MAFGGSAFGASSSSLFAFNSQPSLFASAPSTSFPQSNTPFSQQNPPSSIPWSSNTNPTPTIPPNGTRAVPYQISTLQDSVSSDPARYVTISAMEPFRPFTVEELRLADYQRGDKGTDQPNSQTPSAPPTFASASTPAFSSNPSNPFGPGPTPHPSAPSPFANPQAPNSLFASAPSNPTSNAFAPSNSLFGAPAAANPSPNTPFGSTANSLFASSAPSSLFASSSTGLFASSPAFGPSSSAFAAASAPSLFGAPATPALFGSTQTPAPSPFAASSAAMGASGAFGAGFAPASAAQTAQSLFGATSFGTGFGAAASSGAGLFGSTGASAFASTGSGLFGNTGGGMFGSTGGGLFGASSGGSLFGGGGQTGFGAGFGSSFGGGFGIASNQNAAQLQQQQQAQGPLQASLTNNPFGDSMLFAGLPPNSQSAGQSGPAASVVNVGTAAGQSQQKALAVVVKPTSEAQKRTRSSDLMARQTVMRRNNQATGWFTASPMRPWGENGPVFDMSAAFRSYDGHKGGSRNARGAKHSVTPWRTEDQRIKAENLKKLVIEPMADDPILQVGKTWLTVAPGTFRQESNARAVARAGDELDVQASTPNQHHGVPTSRQPLASAGAVGAGSQAQQTPQPQTTRHEFGDKPVDENMTSRNAEAEQEGELHKTPQRNMTTSGGSTPRTRSTAGGEVRLEKFTPYSDFYKNQMAASKGRTSLGSGERRMSRHRSPHTPISTDPEYYMSPSIDELSEMTSEELSHVDDFTIGRKRKGEVRWLQPVDLRRVNLDEVIHIKDREVSVYPKEEEMPPPGQGLNKPAKVKLFGLHKKDKRTKEPLTDASTAAIMVEKLKGHCTEIGVTFLGYDVKTGTWTFQVDSF